LVSVGKIPRKYQPISTKNTNLVCNSTHFTVVPILDMNGHMVLLVVIIKAKKLPHSWCLGIDMFSEINESNFENNFGQGKWCPGLQLFREGKTKIPICFSVFKKASMTGEIPTKVFKQMDDLGITKPGVDGQLTNPCVIIDGHTSWVDEEFLTYVSKPLTKQVIVLGAPYRTALWQLPDNKRQNGAFKCALVNAKNKMNLKKRVHNLPVGILPQEIVLVARDAVNSSFMNVRYTLSALSHRGMYPFNRNPLLGL